MNIHKYIYIYILLCSILVAQEPFTSKEWKEITCDGIENINCNEMLGLQDDSNCYIVQCISYNEGYIYKFTGNGENATITKTYNTYGMAIEWKSLIHGTDAYTIPGAFKLTSLQEYIKSIVKVDYTKEGQEAFSYYDATSYIESGSLFMIDNVLYLLTNKDNGTLIKIQLIDSIPPKGEIKVLHEYPLTYSPNEDTSIVTLNNTIYYFSNKGFCSTKISDDSADSNIISSVSVTDATSSIVTDQKSKIWIINKTDGVVEYNTKDNTATTIATFPASRLSNRTPDFTKACFYSDNYLYLITNGKVYSLDVTPPDDPDDPDDPDNPDNPQKPHDQSGHHCGCLGIEFVCLFLGFFLLRHRH